MRVNSGIEPSIVSIEKYMPIDGYVEIRIRENISSVETEDGLRFEYDEYVFRMPDTEGLSDEINNNLNDWLATGRTIEVNESASVIQDMRKALEVMGVSINE